MGKGNLDYQHLFHYIAFHTCCISLHPHCRVYMLESKVSDKYFHRMVPNIYIWVF